MTDHGYTSTIHPPSAPKKKGWRIRHIAGAYALGGIILGLVIGGSNTPDPVTVQVPGPERVVEKKVEVEVPVTPEACITALDLNEEAFTGLAQSLKFVQEQDYAAAKANNDEVALLVPKVNAAKSECRAAK